MAKMAQPIDSYATVEAIALTGITQPMLNYLCRVGVVLPTVSRRHGKRGHGEERRYAFRDLISFKVIKHLTESGVSPVKVKAAIRELHQLGVSFNTLPADRVKIFGKSVYKWDDGSDPMRIRDGQMAFGFVLDLKLIREQLIGDIERLRA